MESTARIVDLMVTRALRQVGESPGASVGVRSLRDLPTPGGAPEERWDSLRTALVGLTEPVILVVDDCDEAAGPARHSLLAALLENGPELLRIVLIGQHEPPLHMAKARVVGHVDTIGVTELAFRPEETAGLARVMGRDLAAEQLAELQAWTCGWPVAVQLGLLNVDGARVIPSSDAGDVQRMLSALVVENVLERMPKHLSAFVLAATTVSGLDSEVARELSGRADSAALLEECVDRGLFLDRYRDDGWTRYRWHPVFAELCRAVLQQRDPELARELHRAAAVALTRRGHPLQATEHAVSAGDEQLAASILRSRWLSAVLETRGLEAARALGEITRRPDADPGLMLAHACTLDVAGDRIGARGRYAEARRAMGDESHEPDEQVAAMRALAELILGDSAELLGSAADVVHEAMRSGSFPDDSTRAAATFVLGWTELRLRRNPRRAADILHDAAAACDRTGQREIAGRARVNLAFAKAFSGDFSAAIALLDTASEGREADRAWANYDGGMEHFTRGFVAFHRQDLDSAEVELRIALANYPDSSYVALVGVYLALVAAARGVPRVIEEAQAGLRRVPETEEHGVPWGNFRALAHASLLAASGRLDEAAATLEGSPPSEHTPILDATSARILERAGRPLSATAALERIRPGAADFIKAHALVTQALMGADTGQADLAHELIEEALDLAVPQAASWAFSGRDERLRSLLRAHAIWGTRHEPFVAQQLAQFDGVHSASLLSPREHEILSYLRTQMTTAEISQALFVSVNTVKTHQRAIYRKLGVSSRREAVRVEQVMHRVAHRDAGPPTETIWGGVHDPSSTSERG
ncbi:MAG TPA: LuxR C-terminal-related transcriptional regulator [Ornithinicoccus sp.]|nr:LuxR C-terminal-related transcriptional regulator [Ornithinicoccus sp.]